MSEQKQTMTQRLRELTKEVRRKWMGFSVGIILAVGLGLIFSTTGLGTSLIFDSYDKLFYFRYSMQKILHQTPRIPDEAVMVFLDDASHKHLNQKYLEPWDRSYHSKLIRRLTKEKARAVVYDVVFSDLMNSNKDAEFIQAIQENGNVVLAIDWTTENFGGERSRGWQFPAQPFAESAGGEGSSAMFPEKDLMIRQFKPHSFDEVSLGGIRTNMPVQYASEAWVAAQLIGDPITHENIDTNHPPPLEQQVEFKTFWINYYAPENLMKGVSFYKAIADQDTNVPPGYFSNKVVFVGARLQTQTQGARKDEYPSPYSFLDENKFMPGVAIHTTTFLNLTRHDGLQRFPFVVERAIIIFLGIVLGFGLVHLRPLMATMVAVATCLPVIGLTYFFFARYYFWFPWLIIILGVILPSLVWGITYNTIQLFLEKARVEQSLSMYLSPKLVKKFAADPSLLKPGAKKQMLTILFSDIAGFTTISEGMDSDDLAHAMNRYFQTAVTNCVHSTDGTVVKYIGDAIFAFWNAPEPQIDHALRACTGALKFRGQEAQFVNGHELITRIGLHTGLANVGNFGSDTRVDYTAISENINLASRMEGLNKYLGTIILITGETKEEVGEKVVTRYLGLFILKGFEKSVQVYELVGLPEAAAESQVLRDSFAEALKKFHARDLAGAKEAFLATMKIKPEDGPCKFYLEQLEELTGEELDADWKGEVKLKDK